jgi:hypothetical protein
MDIFDQLLKANDFSSPQNFGSSDFPEEFRTEWRMSTNGIPDSASSRKMLNNPSKRRSRKEGVTNKLYPPLMDTRRSRPTFPGKRPIYRNGLPPLSPPRQSAGVAFPGVEQKSLAKPSDAKEMIICALRFGDTKFPRGMLYYDIVESMRGAYELPNTPTFNMALTNTLSHLVARGVVSKVEITFSRVLF